MTSIVAALLGSVVPKDRLDELNHCLWNLVDPVHGLTEEFYWKEFIGDCMEYGGLPNDDIRYAIQAGECHTGKECPEAIKSTWNRRGVD